MSETMTIETERFHRLESSVHDIDKRMMPIERAIPSIDQTLKKLAETLHQQQISDAVQKEKTERQDATNKRLGDKLSAVQVRVSENEKKLLKITTVVGALTIIGANIIPVTNWISSFIK